MPIGSASRAFARTASRLNAKRRSARPKRSRQRRRRKWKSCTRPPDPPFFCCNFAGDGILKAMPKMRAVQVPRPKGPFEMVERDVPDPGPGSVRVRVEACGICHSDSLTKEGVWPGIEYPRVPGHEIAGTVDAIGAGVNGWTEGQRVGIGWFGGNCGWCDRCRRGDLV